MNVRNIRSSIEFTSYWCRTKHSRVGNYRHKYEVLNTFGMREQRHYLRRIDSDIVQEKQTYPKQLSPPLYCSSHQSCHTLQTRSTWDESTLSIPRPLTELTGSKSIITTRFSAPGGIETMSRNYLDITSGEYSAYNSLNFRNLTVRGSGSGETGTIRVNSHANRREGLRTLLSRHCGKFGIDSAHGQIFLLIINLRHHFTNSIEIPWSPRESQTKDH